MNSQIPDKLYFKIGEVAEITGVKPHVLRYWESEFSPFKPTKSRSKQRLYRRKDVELVLQLKDLLYNQGFTIAGAKKQLKAAATKETEQMALPLEKGWERRILEEVKEDLIRLRNSLQLPSE